MRVDFLDIAKGLSIFLVVIGHTHLSGGDLDKLDSTFSTMLFRSLKLSFFVATFVLAALGCSKHESDSNPISATSDSNAISKPATDQWLGKWIGPEGTFLLLTGENGKYEITIQNLDGPLIYQGTAADGQIQFMRNDVKETIRATNGEETGMKWLSDKSNCLTIRSGEGYCR